MPNPTAQEIQKMCETHQQRTTPLRDRFIADYKLYRLEAFTQALKKGNNKNAEDSITCNSPALLGGKVIEYLADGEFKFSVPIDAKQKKKDRGKANTNELFAYAMNDQAEDHWQIYPEHAPLKAELAFYATVRGWIARRVFLWEEDGEIIADVAQWDPYSTYWGTGAKGLEWAAYGRYATQDEIDGLYNKKIEPDRQGRIAIYDWWGKDFEIVSCGGEIIYENEHKLGYVPVYIKPVGATPQVQADITDAIKDVGESIYFYDRSIFPVENEIATLYKMCIRKGVLTPKVLWSTGPATGDSPFESDPYKDGSIVVVDSSKYSKVEEFIKPTMPADANAFMNFVLGMKNMGGLSPILNGNIDQQQTAQGLNILNHNALTILKPRKKAMEACQDWTTRELISQFIAGKFKKQELSGVDPRDKQYAVTISAKDLDLKRRVKTTLMLNLPQDDLQNAGVVTTLVQAGLISRQTGRDKYLNVQDADAEEALIDMEKIKAIPEVQLPVAAAQLVLDGRINEAKAVLAYMQRGQQQQPGNAQVPPEMGAMMKGVRRPMPPGAAVMRGPAGARPNVPRELQEKARLNAIGLER